MGELQDSRQQGPAPEGSQPRYTIISSDCHAGGNMAAYEE